MSVEDISVGSSQIFSRWRRLSRVTTCAAWAWLQSTPAALELWGNPCSVEYLLPEISVSSPNLTPGEGWRWVRVLGGCGLTHTFPRCVWTCGGTALHEFILNCFSLSSAAAWYYPASAPRVYFYKWESPRRVELNGAAVSSSTQQQRRRAYRGMQKWVSPSFLVVRPPPSCSYFGLPSEWESTKTPQNMFSLQERNAQFALCVCSQAVTWNLKTLWCLNQAVLTEQKSMRFLK